MLDFLTIATRIPKRGILEVYPKFIIKKSSDLMIRGGDFYAVWIEELGLWSTDEQDALALIDRELDEFANKNKNRFDEDIRVLHMWDSENGMIDRWHKYCQKHLRDDFHMLDEKLIFSNDVTSKTDYASKRLNYPLETGKIDAYERLISTLYTDEERHKIEWAIGSIVSGDSKKIQKFLVLYGSAGTGKSTILNIIQQLFDGYYSVFDAKALGSTSNSFALEAFKTNPLVAIQHDGDLSKIEDNTRLNSLVSHELMTVNEKFKATYPARFKCFLFMGTNKPVKITDAKSGLIRRLIDVTPSGNKVPANEYKDIMKRISFELGAIAMHCLNVYKKDKSYYDSYIPINMMGASNDFYNFVIDSFHTFKREDGTTLKSAWEMYKTYCEEAKVPYSMSKMRFKEELKNYFHDFDERFAMDDGTRVRSYYSRFRADKFESEKKPEGKIQENKPKSWIEFKEQKSVLDDILRNCPAQYAGETGTPTFKWNKCTTRLRELDTSRLHYVKLNDIWHIVVDFDIPDEFGNKSYERNLEEASKWPPTYAELSKSGAGIHLHYIYKGDAEKLSRIYADHIEIKVFSGDSSLRRQLTQCNDLPVAEISSGLPLKGEKMVNTNVVKSEKGLRSLILRNLNKEIHAYTRPSIDFIFKILEDAYESGIPYDVSDMQNAVIAFAASSSNQSDYCLKVVKNMKFKSENASENTDSENEKLVFYDIEVFPNLLLINWKLQGEGNPVVRMINPKPEDIEELIKFRLVGFNCRRYDNHIVYARLMGYDNEQIYKLSQKIISGTEGCFFSEAYNLSYTDVYDFASAGNKKSLKKLEIEMGIHHQELGLPWDEPVPEELWTRVAEYCDNDVIATEAAFNYLSADWTARQILADLAGMTVNDTTNSLTTRIIFGSNKKPQDQFCYRNLAEPVFNLDNDVMDFLREACPDMMSQRHGDAGSLLPYFEGYEYKNGISTYRGEEVGEGGYVYSEPGMYGNVALLDIASMHPHSTIAECLFGPKFTRAYRDIVEGRVSIKHEAWDIVNGMLDGKLTKFIQRVINGEMTSAQLANALKTAINSVYGLTSAKFDNPFRDRRNVDNIVAKRGALFMIDLKHEVQKRGFTVAHIKTDSIKIPDATPEIIEFVMEFGKKYGYTFEHEATYDRMCLVNKAVYIAKYKDGKHAGEWTATGDEFAVPYIFKKLFSKEEVTFEDMCETFAVSKGDLYLDFNEGMDDVSKYEKELEKLEKDIAKELKTNGSETPNPEKMQRKAELIGLIAQGHNYHFVGRVGQFTPVRPNNGGGYLYRMNNDKYYAAPGSTGYRWMESEILRKMGKEDIVDREFYDNLLNDAIKDIISFGDYEWFVSDDPYIPPRYVNGRPVYDDGMIFA